MSLLRTFVDRSRASLSLMALVLIAGLMSQSKMPVELNPNVTVPAVVITVRHDGISPEDGTRLLVRPIEKELKHWMVLSNLLLTPAKVWSMCLSSLILT